MHKLLVIDDDPNWINVFLKKFPSRKYKTRGNHDYRKTLEEIETFKPDLVFLDYDFGQGSTITGLDILKEIRATRTSEQLKVFILTGFGDGSKIGALRSAGADKVISKAKASEDIIEYVERVLACPEPGRVAQAPWEECVIGASDCMVDLVNQVIEAAQARCGTLFIGEVGTGKEVLARYYRKVSEWCKSDLVYVGCYENTNGLFDIEYFGCRKNALPTVREDVRGKVQQANHGIVFFNDIDKLSLDMQDKLLSIFDQQEYIQLGNPKKIRLHSVILSSTRRDLGDLVNQGRFNHALYSRLEKNIIRIPPLREHLEDIPALADYFVREYNTKERKNIRSIEGGAIEYLQNQSWPRNIRQLKQCIHYGARASLDGDIHLKDIKGFFAQEKEFFGPKPAGRKAATARESVLEYRDIRLSPEKHRVFMGNEELDLRVMEFKLLKLFIERKGFVLTRQQIMDHIQKDPNAVIEERTIDGHVKNLRKKIGENGNHIRTVHGVGYSLEE